MSDMSEVRIGVIGGSGLYSMEGLDVVERRQISTPWGEPSDDIVLGHLEGVPVAFLARHGEGHRLMPTEINFRANVWALKTLGVERIVAVGAVGSMREGLAPLHVVVPDQFLDRTRHRPDTFFGDGLVAHVSLADPICSDMATRLAAHAEEAGATVHRGGTYLCMEGPQFSTRAESHAYRQWGVDIIGMTNLQEARLAREAEICYSTLAMVTDYDCWHDDEDDVTVHNVLEILRQNARLAQDVVRRVVVDLAEADRSSCECGSALQYALITDPSRVPAETRERLDLLVGRYLQGQGSDG